ncbi:MAG: type IV pilus assembly protein PilM [Candidatus Omnitrophica bacterium]|nr:type IV pilus assembly protein PilM [Candidatus Omnitrophota bacterium]
MNLSFKKLKNFFSIPLSSSVGLDIGSSQVKMLELQKKEGKFCLINWGISEIKEDISEAVKQAMEGANPVKSPPRRGAAKSLFNRVNISLSGPEVIIRYVDLPKMSAEELEKSLKFEVEKYLPFKTEEMLFDWQVLSYSGQNKMKVLLCATKKNFAEERIKAVEKAGLTPKIVDIDTLCLVNSFYFNNFSENKTVCLLNIGAITTNLNIVEKGESRLSRDIEIDGKEISQASEQNAEGDSAEDKRIENNGEENEKAVESVSPALETLLNETLRCFDFYESQYEKGIEKICLSGGAANFVGVKKFLEEKIGIEAEIWNPLQSIQTQGFEELKERKSEFAIAVGLAIRTC